MRSRSQKKTPRPCVQAIGADGHIPRYIVTRLCEENRAEQCLSYMHWLIESSVLLLLPTPTTLVFAVKRDDKIRQPAATGAAMPRCNSACSASR